MLFIFLQLIIELFLDEVSHVGWELLNNSVVESLDVLQHLLIILGDEVNSYTLTTESSTSTDSVEVVLWLGWEVIVDDKRNLLDVDTTG